MTVITLPEAYVPVECTDESHGPGGLAFAMTRTFYDKTHREGFNNWYCPMGHRRHWLAKSVEQQLRDSKSREVALQDQLRAAIRDAETGRVELLRIRARVANGVCPCCNRSFANVRNHMHTQHPQYAFDYHVEPVKKFKCSCGSSFKTFRGLRTHQGHMRGDDWDDPKTPKRWTWGGSHLTEVGAR